ncbi:Cytochrome c biogenesis protein CcdA [Nonomuraea maritima]|uniref:Cytochrome c biogenesis protein CcdA n=2 Tax=Nonomuraea maritima TaxID=683260 RepID=A0A1G8WGR6_9ACTN|nr:Cytochrome c biogenesis protein CcdA [Nonomuraea maritima]
MSFGMGVAEAPLALALTAGMVAAFNPCGFAMLPAYLTLLINDQGAGPLRRALVLSAAMTAGFVTVFGLFGSVVTVLAVSVGGQLPWATLVIGAILVGLGLWLLSGRELLLRLPGLATGRPTTSPLSLYGYGVSYASASLSCTVGPFLAVVSAGLSGGGMAGGMAAFATYALGMGSVIAALSLAVAVARAAVVARLRRLLPYVSRTSGALLTLAGLYVLYYGWYELRVFAGADADDPIVGAATAVQAAVAGWVARLGPGWIGVVLVLMGLAALALRMARRSRAR